MKQSVLVIRAVASSLIFFAYVVRSEPNVGDEVYGFEPQLLTNRYGVSSITIVSNGFLFIDQKYVPAPYCVQRVGQGIIVNDILVNHLFVGDPDETEKANSDWRAPRHGFRADTLKEFADLQIMWLTQGLYGGGAAFIETKNAKRVNINEMPIVVKLSQHDIDRVLHTLMTDKPKANRVQEIIALNLKGLKDEEAIQNFLDMAVTSTQLLQRVTITDPVR
jgi:hypothetical protein